MAIGVSFFFSRMLKNLQTLNLTHSAPGKSIFRQLYKSAERSRLTNPMSLPYIWMREEGVGRGTRDDKDLGSNSSQRRCLKYCGAS
jgi:hypothetical protein